MTAAETLQQLRDRLMWEHKPTADGDGIGTPVVLFPSDLWPLALDVIEAANHLREEAHFALQNAPGSRESLRGAFDLATAALAAFLGAAQKETTSKGDDAT